MPAGGGVAGDSWQKLSKTRTFDATAGNGAVGTATFFTVTGLVAVRKVVGHCTADLTEAAATATFAMGFVGATAVILAQVNATTIDAGQWSSNVSAFGLVSPAGAARVEYVVDDDDIIATIGAQNVNGGTLTYYLEWQPIEAGATVVAA